MDELDALLEALGNASVIFRLPQVGDVVAKAKSVYDGLRSDLDGALSRVEALEAAVAAIVPPPVTPAMTTVDPATAAQLAQAQQLAAQPNPS